MRLWTYHIWPVFWDITSPVMWVIAFLLMPPFFMVFCHYENRYAQRPPLRKILYRVLFIVISGCACEVLINEFVFKAYAGQPLYVYDVLPTFDGSGSRLSPLYYLSFYTHFPFMDRLLPRS